MASVYLNTIRKTYSAKTINTNSKTVKGLNLGVISKVGLVVPVNVVLNRTVVVDSD